MAPKMHEHKCNSEIDRSPSQRIEHIEWIAIKMWAKEAKKPKMMKILKKIMRNHVN